MKPALTLFYAVLCLFSLQRIDAQITVSVNVLSGSATTTCTDPFDGPDPGWSIDVEETGWVQYDGTGNCVFPALPNVQYQAAYNFQHLVPSTIKVCFEAYEHDPNIVVGTLCSNRACIEELCFDLAVPLPGQSADYTLALPAGLSSGGSASVRVITTGEPISPGIGLCSYTLAYGTVETDINRGYKTVQTAAGDFVIAGVWNDQAYLMKTDKTGNQLAFRTYGAEIGGTSNFLDLEITPDGDFVATGECRNCATNDPTVKVIVVKTDGNLQPEGIRKFGVATGGPFPSTTQRYSPALAVTPDGLLLASTVEIGGALNAEDLVLTKLSFSLDSLWSKFHLLGFFERAADVATTPDGYALVINRAFLTDMLVLKTNLAGDALWSKVVVANELNAIEYLPDAGQLAVAGSRATGSQEADILLHLCDAGSGDPGDFLIFGDPLNDSGRDLAVLDDGNLLLAAHLTRPNASGTYLTSRVYQVQTTPLQVTGFHQIPNPDDITNIGVESVVPLNCDGSNFAATGIRGFYNRTFFHSIQRCGAVVSAASGVLCENGNIQLTAAEGADSYLWSTGDTTQNILVSAGGTYNVMVHFGCVTETDSVTVTQIPAVQTQLNASVCEGKTHTLPDGSVVAEPGIYDVILTAASGCDSIVSTILTVLENSVPVTVEATICTGEMYTLPNGIAVSQSGIYQTILTNSTGCDSLITTSLTVLQNSAPVTVEAAICTDDKYTLPNGAIVSTAGTYQSLLTNSTGCDSLITTTLTVLQNSAPVTVEATICTGDTYTLPNGTIVSTAGTYQSVLTNNAGCDSLITSILTVLQNSVPSELDTIICFGEAYALPDGVMVSVPGIYQTLLTNSVGCDSLVYTVLGVTGPIIVTDTLILPDTGGGVGSIQVTVSGGLNVYQFLWSNGATASVNTGLTAGDYTLTVTEGYGCSWVFTFHVPLMTAAQDVETEEHLRVYPNPFEENVTFEIAGDMVSQEDEIRLYDVAGKIVTRKRLSSNRTTLETGSLPAGYYTAEYWRNGRKAGAKKLLKVSR